MSNSGEFAHNGDDFMMGLVPAMSFMPVILNVLKGVMMILNSMMVVMMIIIIMFHQLDGCQIIVISSEKLQIKQMYDHKPTWQSSSTINILSKLLNPDQTVLTMFFFIISWKIK